MAQKAASSTASVDSSALFLSESDSTAPSTAPSAGPAPPQALHQVPAMPLPPPNYHELGIAAFRDRDYDEALLLFSRAIANDPENPRLYDSRSVAYERLGNFGYALADARTTAILRPHNHHGFLRVARMLVKMKRPFKAVSAYTLAMETVEGQERDMIRAERKVAMQQHLMAQAQFQATHRCHIDQLPQELVVDIMGRLELKQRLRCARVCKSWRAAVYHSPLLWREMTLVDAVSDGAYPTKLAALYRKRLGDVKLRCLTFSRLARIRVPGDDITRPLFEHDLVGQLEEVRIDDQWGRAPIEVDAANLAKLGKAFGICQGSRLTITVLDLRFDRHVAWRHPFSQFLAAFPNLVEFSLKQPGGEGAASILQGPAFGAPDAPTLPVPERPKLRRLTLVNSRFRREEAPVSLPELRQLHLGHGHSSTVASMDLIKWNELGSLVDLRLERSVNATGEWSWPGLHELPELKTLVLVNVGATLRRRVDLGGFGVPTNTIPGPTADPPLVAPQLERLGLGTNMDGSMATYCFLLHNLRGFPKLVELDLNGALMSRQLGRDSSSILESSFRRLPNLRYIDLSHTQACNRPIEVISTNCATKLRVLKLANCPEVTGSPLVRVAKRVLEDQGDRLELLDADYCPLVTREATDRLLKMVHHLSAKHVPYRAPTTTRERFAAS